MSEVLALDPKERTRERILEAFIARARVDGTRSVVMAELARDLGMSTRTLYQHFASKADLVTCLMERWVADVERDLDANRAKQLPPVEHLMRTADIWLEGHCRFSPTFWDQVHRDFPEASSGFHGAMRALLHDGRDRLAAFIRDDVDPGLAHSLLNAALAAASDPDRCDRLGLSRSQAVRQAIEIWVRGVLRPERSLHVVADPD